MRVYGSLKPQDWSHWGQFTTFKSNAPALLRLLQEGLMKYHFQAEPETPAIAKSTDPDPASAKK